MPQPASHSIYVQEHQLVSLTPFKIRSCGQPLRQYRARGYQMVCLGSDTRCRSRTESGDSSSESGKSRNLRKDQRWPLRPTLPGCCPELGTPAGTPCISALPDSTL